MNTALKRIRILCAAIFVAGIAGIIVVLLTASTIATNKHIDAFDEVAAEQLEQQVSALIASGADEDALREAVRAAIDLGRSIS